MHGAGNDFVLLDLYERKMARSDEEWATLAVAICDRHFGVGADGLLLVLPSDVADARMRMFNPDGSESASCGNGIRCLGRFLNDRYRLSSGLRVETGAGVSAISVHLDGSVTVDMGAPLFNPIEIPTMVSGENALHVPLSIEGRSFDVNCVSMGNPHAVAFLEANELDSYPLESVGPRVEHHELFPERTNFEICEVLDGGHMRVRVWERGAGITLACGTGACASAVIAMTLGRVQPPVTVELPGGALMVDWAEGGSVMMTGPTAYVFTGTWPSPESRVPGPESDEARDSEPRARNTELAVGRAS